MRFLHRFSPARKSAETSHPATPTTCEALEDRRLLSVSISFHADGSVPSPDAIVVRRAPKVRVSLVGTFDGSLSLTMPAGGESAPTTVAATLQITSQSARGRLQGTFSTPELGTFPVRGRRVGNRFVLRFGDGASGQIKGRVFSHGNSIVASIDEAAAGKSVAGVLSLVRETTTATVPVVRHAAFSARFSDVPIRGSADAGFPKP